MAIRIGDGRTIHSLGGVYVTTYVLATKLLPTIAKCWTLTPLKSSLAPTSYEEALR